MKQCNYFFPLFSIALAFVFLWTSNKEIHKDFENINEEIKNVSQTITMNESAMFYKLTMASKKRISYQAYVDDYLALKEKAFILLDEDKTISKDVFNIDLRDEFSDCNPYLDKSIESNFPRLAKNYMLQALTYNLKERIDKTTFNKDIKYSSKLIVINEPLVYHVGRKYKLGLEVINIIDSSFDNLFHIDSNGATFSPSDFPLAHSEHRPIDKFVLQTSQPDLQFLAGVIPIINNDN